MSIRKIGKGILSRMPWVDGMFRRVVWSRVHFPEREMRFLGGLPAGACDIAVDVGAATGSYAWILNRISRQVFAFEPGEAHHRALSLVQGGTRIELVKAAVGATEGTVNMYTPGEDTHALHSATLSKVNPVAGQADVTVRQVPQISLDSYFLGKRDTGRSIDLLKVDVEGYEFDVFRGAEGLIKRHHPLIICEIEARHDPEYLRTFNFLRGLGYAVYVFRDGGFRVFAEDDIQPLQSHAALEVRLSDHYDPANNVYVNNFTFQHPLSRVKVDA